MARDALAQIVEQRRAGDPNLHYLEGRPLYGQADAEVWPLPDGPHADLLTHRLIVQRFTQAVPACGALAG